MKLLGEGESWGDGSMGGMTGEGRGGGWRSDGGGGGGSGELGAGVWELLLLLLPPLSKREEAKLLAAGPKDTPFGPKLMRMPSRSSSRSSRFRVLQIRTERTRLGSVD